MKIFLDSVGCRLNQSEIEKMARRFREAGHEIVARPSQADVVVVNTCAVTAEAASDSRQKVRQAARAGAAHIALTGCWATLDPEAAAALEGVRWLVPNARKDMLPDVLALDFDRTSGSHPLARQPLPGIHLRTRAFIKAQDGCDNHCTYCITRLVRGRGRSMPVEDVLEDIRFAVEGGVREVVLTGVHLGSWGQDLQPQRSLGELIEKILARSTIERLRLSSLEPWDLSEDFFSLWRDDRLCRQLHLPLQSGDANTLRRMARKTTPQAYAALVAAARQVCPDMAVTTDLIAGFPGESEQEFASSLDFVRQMDFAGGHVFTFSARPTPAAQFPQQVHPAERKSRAAQLRQALVHAAQRYRQGLLGQIAAVLWETCIQVAENTWRLEGLSSNYLRVCALSPRPLWNEISRVKLTTLTESVVLGTIMD